MKYGKSTRNWRRIFLRNEICFLNMIEPTCRQLAEVVVAVQELAAAAVVGLCWHFEFVRELVESLNTFDKHEHRAFAELCISEIPFENNGIWLNLTWIRASSRWPHSGAWANISIGCVHINSCV